MACSSLAFKVRKREAVLVQPAAPTPVEEKALSDLDNEFVEFASPSRILLYKSESSDDDGDPAEMIKRALAKALVYYYPWAGRLKEARDGKVVVDCTAQGVAFVEADAEIRIDQFQKDSLQGPFPCIQELLCTKHSGSALDNPLLGMQVTRLLCGGFILSVTSSHVMSDGSGVAQFLNAVAELASGADEPSVLPVWCRELLNAREPPPPVHNTTLNNFFKPKPVDHDAPVVVEKAYHHTVVFGKREVAAIRARVPERLRGSCSSFDLIVACVLHCRVTSLQHAPDEQAAVVFTVNCRSKFVDPPIPAGFYGNAVSLAIFTCPKSDLHDLGRAVEHVKKAKEAVDEDYAKSMTDIAVRKRRSAKPTFPDGFTTYVFNDWSRLGLSTLRFGSWGTPVFVGQPYNPKSFTNLMLPFTNFENGEEGRLLKLCMPQHAIHSFLVNLQSVLALE